LPFLIQAKSCFSALLFLSKCVVRVSLLFDPWPPIWLPQLLLTWVVVGQSLGP
jgi:hypothetical protein